MGDGASRLLGIRGKSEEEHGVALREEAWMESVGSNLSVQEGRESTRYLVSEGTSIRNR